MAGNNSNQLHFDTASHNPTLHPPTLPRPPSSSSNHAPEPASSTSSRSPTRPHVSRADQEGLIPTPHEKALPGRGKSRAGTGAIVYRRPGRALFDRFYGRRRGRAGIAGETSALGANGVAGAEDMIVEDKQIITDDTLRIEPDHAHQVYPGRGDDYGDDRSRWRRKRTWVVIAIILMILAIALGVGLGVGLRHHSKSTPDSSPHCPENNGTTLHSHGQSFVQLCGQDWRSGEQVAPNTRRHVSSLERSERLEHPAVQRRQIWSQPGQTVQDLPNNAHNPNHTTGVIAWTFQACVDACAQYNVQHGTAPSGSSRVRRALLRERQSNNDDDNGDGEPDEDEPDEDESPDPSTSTAQSQAATSAASAGASSTATSSPSSGSAFVSSTVSGTASNPTASSTNDERKCWGVTYIGNMTFVEYGNGQGDKNMNCYLKSAIPATGQAYSYEVHNDTASAQLLQ